MDQVKKLLGALTPRQLVSIVIAAIAVVGAVMGLSRWQRESGMRPLYTGLAPEDASAIVQKLREAGVDFKISSSGTEIMAPEDKVPELRLQMAGSGLPKTGRIGFEIFDKTNFGITDFAEHVNYRRALEGELERSVMAISDVQQARVHVTLPKDSVFSDARESAKASVLVGLRPGTRLSSTNVVAITNLVSSAVEGLTPESVSVVDMNGTLLSRPRRDGLPDTEQASVAVLEYKQSIEHDLAAKINNTLEPLLGADKFRTGVSADIDMTSGEQSEETFDPSKSVMLSSQKTEDSSGVTRTLPSAPGTAANLAPQQAAKFAMRVIFFRIPAHISQASQAESILLSFLFVEVDPANPLFLPFVGEGCIDGDRAQPGQKARLRAEPSNVAASAQHRFLNQVVCFICISGITARKAVKHLLVAAEQFTQSTGFSVLRCDDEFFIASLPTATFFALVRRSRIHFARERQFRLVCQLHCIPHMRPESAPS